MPASEPASDGDGDRVWYAAYGSNMNFDRFNYYLSGGRPPGGTLTYPGCRDRRPPQQNQPLTLPGQVYFALESLAWTGGMAFYDPAGPGGTPARGYLLHRSQFSDIAAQEMRHEPGTDLELTEALTTGWTTFGSGRYQRLVHLGSLDGHPIFTFTAPWSRHDVPGRKPAAIYLRLIASGLLETHGWDVAQIAGYLSSRPGAAGHWPAEELAAVLADLTEAPAGTPAALAADLDGAPPAEDRRTVREMAPASVGLAMGAGVA